MGGIVSMITGGGTPKPAAVDPGPTVAELAAKDAQAAKDAAVAAGDRASLSADKRRASLGSGSTLLTGLTSNMGDVQTNKNILNPVKSTLGG